MAAIAHVFTIGYVAEMLGEDEERLHELSIDMFPEDGCLHADSGPLRTVIPMHCGQRSGDCGQLLMSV